jgi:hypothetical protein
MNDRQLKHEAAAFFDDFVEAFHASRPLSSRPA